MIVGAKKHEYAITKKQEAENQRLEDEWRKSTGVPPAEKTTDGPKGKSKGVKGKFDKPKGKGTKAKGEGAAAGKGAEKAERQRRRSQGCKRGSGRTKESRCTEAKSTAL